MYVFIMKGIRPTFCSFSYQKVLYNLFTTLARGWQRNADIEILDQNVSFVNSIAKALLNCEGYKIFTNKRLTYVYKLIKFQVLYFFHKKNLFYIFLLYTNLIIALYYNVLLQIKN